MADVARGRAADGFDARIILSISLAATALVLVAFALGG
jgi:hypothetical protein